MRMLAHSSCEPHLGAEERDARVGPELASGGIHSHHCTLHSLGLRGDVSSSRGGVNSRGMT